MLYIIATPIGNLKDVTLRALEVLEEVDVLLCEDTRNTGLLLQNLKVVNKPRLESFYDEVEMQKIPKVVEMLKEGLDVGLVSDAGTPLISDPGWLLVKKCQELGIGYTSVPGVSAVIDALVLSGLPAARFCFLGFMPKKEGDVRRVLTKYKDFDGTKIIYESPLRAEKTVSIIKEVFVDVEIRIVREMTKKFEEVSSTVLDNRGEVTIVFN